MIDDDIEMLKALCDEIIRQQDEEIKYLKRGIMGVSIVSVIVLILFICEMIVILN